MKVANALGLRMSFRPAVEIAPELIEKARRVPDTLVTSAPDEAKTHQS